LAFTPGALKTRRYLALRFLAGSESRPYLIRHTGANASITSIWIVSSNDLRGFAMTASDDIHLQMHRVSAGQQTIHTSNSLIYSLVHLSHSHLVERLGIQSKIALSSSYYPMPLRHLPIRCIGSLRHSGPMVPRFDTSAPAPTSASLRPSGLLGRRLTKVLVAGSLR